MRLYFICVLLAFVVTVQCAVSLRGPIQRAINSAQTDEEEVQDEETTEATSSNNNNNNNGGGGIVSRMGRIPGVGSYTPRPNEIAVADFKYYCMLNNVWHIYLPNGNIVIYCIWSENEVNSLLHVLEKRASQITSAEKQVVQENSLKLVRRDHFVSICSLQCTYGSPYPRFNLFDGSETPEPDTINVGCHEWDKMKCKASCPDSAFNVPNGYVVCSDGAFTGSSCQLSCRMHFQSRGPSEKLCTPHSRTWSPDEPFVCQPVNGATCARLAPIANGRLRCSRNNEILSRCALMCNSGFVPVGPMVQWCLPDDNNRMMWHLQISNSSYQTSAGGGVVQCRSIRSMVNSPQQPVQTTVTVPSTQPTTDQEHNSNVDVTSNGTVSFRYDICDVIPSKRRACFGYQSSSRAQCESRSCCWDGSQTSAPHCYEMSANPSNQASKITSPDPSETTTGVNNVAFSGNNNRPPTSSLVLGQPSEHGNLHAYNRNPDASSRWPPRPHPLTATSCGCAEGVTGRCATVPRSELRSQQLDQQPVLQRDARVYCGNEATAEDFPWNVLVYFHSQVCGGTLLAPQYVVTAGHCLWDVQGPLSLVRINYVFLGVTNTSHPGPGSQMRTIVKILKHPNYTMTEAGYARNDIAIVKLNSPVRTSVSVVKTLCLPGPRLPVGTDECYIMGFGKTSPGSQRTTILQAAKVPLVTDVQCLQYFPTELIPQQHICAGSILPNSPDTCRGDSGGSLACKAKDSGSCGWFLAGITSFGREPCGQAAPSVYVNIFHFQQWIYETLGQLEATNG